ncbi:DUF554 domain-containing protein [Nocardioides marmoribigeumensis]|nr:DUF554 family protein [Nocardioides marmoribigeumensis]
MFPGTGTLVNMSTVLVGASLGVLVGDRLPQRVRDTVTDCLGLVTLLIAGLSVVDVLDPALARAVGDQAPVLVVLGSLVLGGITGSFLRVEDRLEGLGGWLRDRLTPPTSPDSPQHVADGPSAARARFVEGFVTASLLFCVGPLTVLGSLDDGLGRGAEQLYVKAALDGFAAIAFAASFGWGVAASALVVLVVQGGLTLVGVLVGDVLPAAHLAALGATGGLMLLGLGLNLLRVRRLPVGDLLPGLVAAPLLVELLVLLR